MKSRMPNNSKSRLVFDPNEKAAAEETMKLTWYEFRDALASHQFEYDNTKVAKETVFLHQFDDLFQNIGKTMLTNTLSECFNVYGAGRGAVLNPDEKLTYDRFIPKAEHIRYDNRFSPPNVEWLYLALGKTNELIKCCAEKECRTQKGNRFGFCRFRLNPDAGNIKIVDLTVADEMTQTEINDVIISAEKNNLRGSKLRRRFLEFFLLTYAEMMSKNLFIPVADENQKYEYTPFQTLAKYFEAEGYSGIIYSSTVFSKAKNIVLFDKTYAIPYGEILDYTIL